VTAQNNRIFNEFREHAKIITKHNENVLSIIKVLEKASARKEKRMTDLESYIKPQNMIVFDTFLRFKWVFLAWIIFETTISITTLMILAFHINK
jgi:hypothetical protein